MFEWLPVESNIGLREATAHSRSPVLLYSYGPYLRLLTDTTMKKTHKKTRYSSADGLCCCCFLPLSLFCDGAFSYPPLPAKPPPPLPRPRPQLRVSLIKRAPQAFGLTFFRPIFFFFFFSAWHCWITAGLSRRLGKMPEIQLESTQWTSKRSSSNKNQEQSAKTLTLFPYSMLYRTT